MYSKLPLVIFILVSACTVPQNTEVGGSGSPAKRSTQDHRPSQNQNSNVEYIKTNLVTVPVSLEEAKLSDTFQVNTETLSYRFTYLATVKEDNINFQNGVATLLFKDLEVGKLGNLTFIILEGGSPKLKGEITNLTLQPGTNAQKLTLVKIDGTPGSQDIQIEPDVTYAAVKSIFDGRCVSCHNANGSAKGNVLLDKFPFEITNTQKFPTMAALMTRLMDTIENPNSTMPMPRGGAKLSPSDIQTIRTWNDRGLRP